MEYNTDAIRESIRCNLGEMGFADAIPHGETILTQAGYCVGREFRFAGVRAVWMVSQETIKFYADDGAVLRVLDLGEPRQASDAQILRGKFCVEDFTPAAGWSVCSASRRRDRRRRCPAPQANTAIRNRPPALR